MIGSMHSGSSGRTSADGGVRLGGDLLHQLRHRLGAKRQLAAEQLVQADAEREQVGAAVERSPSSCSGDMNEGVPRTMPVLVRLVSVRRAMPKSVTFNSSVSGLYIMLAGLMSRWTTFWRCA